MSAPAPRPPPRRPIFLEPWFQDMMKPGMPPILVSDFEDDPPVTVRYIQGNNDLDFKTVYTSIRTLSHHPGRGLLDTNNEDDPDPDFYIEKKCDPAFLEAFWKCAAYLCDYFADFLAFDTAHMQSVWFHLLDKLQEATILPHYFWISRMPFCEHSEDFVGDTNRLYVLISGLIAPTRIAPPSNILGTDYMNKDRRDDGVSGLKGWQQFLYKDSPGFFVPKSKRLYPMTAGTPTDRMVFEAHIPRGGLAIVDSHTKKLRELTEQVSRVRFAYNWYKARSDKRRENRAPTPEQKHSLSLIKRYTKRKEMIPDPKLPRAPRRHPDLVDPGFQNLKPGLERLNELTGAYKGKDIYQHPDDDDEKFPMLSLGYPEAPQNRTLQSRVDRAAYSEMYIP
ncbi:uncharacterized protein CC84DRAFT_1202884 [Paraphaeosphaeria sporulosa]|uniref:Uncharacterized protein n=1 Tax=Paraphaeosphaeria sporulosa TaxID=1460663 RepID=A0A177CU38_9PLEO|nr:uncharacterized protein CC84DRAFT_1202884 [Paraphaeosphaeria sporulosa]OAG10432.1 hypothetical protein CC84DRAFT_1202884 [Paraphaeosphaeria sporulosa]